MVSEQALKVLPERQVNLGHVEVRAEREFQGHLVLKVYKGRKETPEIPAHQDQPA
jgi:hypothetical protein